MTTSDSDELSFLQRAIRATGALIAQIDATQWQAPTPCEDMDVGDLVAHLVGGLEQFADVPDAGEPDRAPEAAAPPAAPTVPFDRAPAAYEAAGERMVGAWSRPGTLTASYPMPWGDTLGAALVGFLVIEQVTHGWDLARATGRSLDAGDDLAEHALQLARTFDDDSIRVPGMFGPIIEIAPDAPALDRVAAFLGRHP